MAKVLANDHDATFAADDLALIADLLDARLHLHLLAPSSNFLLLLIKLFLKYFELF